MDQKIAEVEINGVKYVRKDDVVNAAPKPGKRVVMVIDRGWIIAGDVEDNDGRVLFTRALHVRKWESIGFDGMIEKPKSQAVVLKPLTGLVDMPADAEIFRVHVPDDWGL